MTGRQKPAFPMFPATRLRRSRARDFSRRLARETRLSPADFILPVFVLDDPDGRPPVESMPGVGRVGHNGLFPLAVRCLALGMPALALCPAVAPNAQSAHAAGAWDRSGPEHATGRRR